MPILRLFLVLMLIGVVGPLFFVFSPTQTSFLIVLLGLEQEVGPALLLLAAATVAFCLGYGAQRLRPMHAPGDGLEISFAFALCVWGVSVAAILFLLGPSPAAAARNVQLMLSKIRGATTSQSLIFCILSVAVFQACFLALDALDRPGRRKTLIVGALVLTTSALSFAMGNRLQCVLVILVPALAAGARGRLRPAMLVPPAALGVALIYLGDLIRRTAQGADVRESGGVMATFLSSFSQLDPMAVALQLSQRVPTTALESLKALAFWPVPRTIIAHKALVAPLVARYLYFGDVTGGITLGLFGEYFYYFGLVGMLLLACATGWASSLLARWAVAGQSIRHYAAFIAVMTLMLSSLRNGLFNDMLTFAFLGFVFAFNWLGSAVLETGAPRAAAWGRSPAR
jgi:oligosaccharide repeat unit polymerase